MKKKDQNKGFTLVELIVVLVILAILAAILVPALLGYIDSAKSKQTVLNAKSALTAAQAEMSNIYATKSEVASAITNTDHVNNISKMADFTSLQTSDFAVGCKTVAGADASNKKAEHDGYTIAWAYYKDTTGELWFNGSEWVETKPTTWPATGIYVITGTVPTT